MPELQVFRNGTVWTGIPGAPDARALAVAGSRVAAVGAAAVGLAQDHPAQVIDLDGGFLMPAFGDGHAHPVHGGLEEQGPQLKDCRSVAQIVAEVRRWAAAHPHIDWVVGVNYDCALVEQVDARRLDQAVPDRPVVLQGNDHRTLWCNTVALRRAGISALTPDPEVGRIDRLPDGSPRGILREWHSCCLLLHQIPGPSAEELVAAIAHAGHAYAACGLTFAQDAWVEPEMVEAYLTAAARGHLTVRVNLAFPVDPGRWRDQRSEFQAQRARVEAAGNPLLTARTVKFSLTDHASGSGEHPTTAPLDVPWERRSLIEAVTAFDAAGFQVHFHAIGASAVRQALDAIEQSVRADPDRDRRPVIAHVQALDPADLPRLAKLGVVANFQPLWAEDARPNGSTIVCPIKDVARSGTTLAFGSDWPAGSHRPLDGIAAAVTCHCGGSRQLPFDAALRAYTSGVAWQAFAEATRGTLAVGRFADLTWLAADPRAVDPRDVPAIPVLGTWLAGRPTYLDPRCDPGE